MRTDCRADRRVQRNRHRHRVGQRDASLVGLGPVRLHRPTIAVDGEPRQWRAKAQHVINIIRVQDRIAPTKMPADQLNRQPERRKIRAASGSTHMLYSPAAATASRLPDRRRSKQGAEDIAAIAKKAEKGFGWATDLQVQNFLECVRTRKTPTATMRLPFQAVIVTQLSNLSLKNGRVYGGRVSMPFANQVR